MAKTMFDNLNAIVANTLTDSIKMIDIDELHESQNNFFIVDRIEEFAETILGQGGVKDNLIVSPIESGGYEIISGHRRKAAVKYLLDKGENVSRYLPCLIQNYNDEDNKMLDIVLMNVSARQISDSELWKSYEIIDHILKNQKNSGAKFGRIREKLGELLGVSPAQVGKMQNVEKNAIPAVKEAVENGSVSISTANEIAKLDEEIQQQLVESDLSSVTHKEVKQITENSAKYENIKEDKPTKNKSVTTESNKSEISKSELKPTEKKVDTYINFEENDDEYDDIAEVSDDTDRDEETQEIPNSDKCGLESFIYEHYFDIEAIFNTYILNSATEDEILIIEKFQKLLRNTKESERNKIRFGI